MFTKSYNRSNWVEIIGADNLQEALEYYKYSTEIDSTVRIEEIELNKGGNLKTILTIILLCLFLNACGADIIPKYHVGEQVKMKIDGKIGMITYTVPGYDYYSYYVRFKSLQATTNTHILGSDGSIDFSPYSEIKVQEFELEPIK